MENNNDNHTLGFLVKQAWDQFERQCQTANEEYEEAMNQASTRREEQITKAHEAMGATVASAADEHGRVTHNLRSNHSHMKSKRDRAVEEKSEAVQEKEAALKEQKSLGKKLNGLESKYTNLKSDNAALLDVLEKMQGLMGTAGVGRSAAGNKRNEPAGEVSGSSDDDSSEDDLRKKRARVDGPINGKFKHFRQVPKRIELPRTFDFSKDAKLEPKHREDMRHPELLNALNQVVDDLQQIQGDDDISEEVVKVLQNGWTKYLGKILFDIARDELSNDVHFMKRIELLYEVYLQVLNGQYVLTKEATLEVRANEKEHFTSRDIQVPVFYERYKQEFTKRFNHAYNLAHAGTNKSATFLVQYVSEDW